jgi:heme/copper-type cytochrome/quinol oxidase subunit 3
VTTAAAAPSQSGRLPARKLSIWLFLGTEIIFFSALILTYVVLRITSYEPAALPWPGLEQVQEVLNIPLTAINTFILILSSVSVVLALDDIQQGKQKTFVRWLVVTLILGCVFLGVQMYEYNVLLHEGLTITKVPEVMKGFNPMFGTTFYTMTGFHGMHVLVGVIALLIVAVKASQGKYTPEQHEGVEAFGLYWHFVDAVWIVLFTLAYILY